MAETTIESELQSLRTKLAAEIEADMKQMEFLKKRLEKNEELFRVIKARLGNTVVTASGTVYGSKRETIRDAIKRIPSNRFTQDDVEREIPHIDPTMDINRNRIRASLWSLVERKELKLVRKGSNQAPAEFEKIEPMHRYRRTTEEAREQTLKNAAATPSNGNLPLETAK